MFFSRLSVRDAALAGVCASAIAALAAACGSPQPPMLRDPPARHDGGLGVQDSGPLACNAASPELGVCACDELGVLTDVPNLYFVLDRSGSMTENDKWGTIRKVVAATMAKVGPRASFGAAYFPGPGGSCNAGVEVMSVRPGDSPTGTYGPTISRLLAATNIAAEGGTPTSATLRGLTPALQKLPGRTFVVLATDGAPNCNFQQACDASQCLLNIEHYGYCQVGGPPNCCTANLYGPAQCLDAQPTLDAVATLAASSIPTYVVGVPGSGPYADLLDSIAVAGGTARSTSPRYYRVDGTDPTAFADALSKIAAKIVATCTFPLAKPPEDPSRVNVYLDGAPVPQDPTDGWTLDETDAGAVVTLVGKTCARVLAGDALSVRVITGCPTVLPH